MDETETVEKLQFFIERLKKYVSEAVYHTHNFLIRQANKSVDAVVQTVLSIITWTSAFEMMLKLQLL